MVDSMYLDLLTIGHDGHDGISILNEHTSFQSVVWPYSLQTRIHDTRITNYCTLIG